MNPTRKTDESFYRLFSASHTVSEHLTKREDSELRDKYDHNAFCYCSQPSADEVRAALAYQKERGDTFLKLEGYEPLADAFGMECEETLTMVLPPETDIRSWKTNPDVSIKAPDADQLEQHELKYYGPLYGDDFTVRNNRNLREKLTYLGAYLGGKLVCVRGLDRDVRVRFPAADVCFRGQNHRQGLFALHAECILPKRRRSAERSCIFTLTPRIHRRNCMRRWDFRPLTSSMNISAPISRN